MGAGCGVDTWRPVAERGVSSAVVVLHRQPPALPARRAAAQRPVALQFFLLAPYTTVRAIRDSPGASTRTQAGSALAWRSARSFSCRALGIAKQRIDQRMGSVATQGEGAQSLRCAYMAAVLAIAALAVREGTEAWRGESCCIPRRRQPRGGLPQRLLRSHPEGH
jgi:hypothetical protein